MRWFLFCLLLFLSCNASKRSGSVSTISAQGLEIGIGESLPLPDGSRITRISVDSALYIAPRKNKAPIIHIEKHKDKSTVKIDSDNKTTDKSREVVKDKSKVVEKDKSKVKTDNSTKSILKLPWWIWLLLVLLIAYGLNKVFKFIPWL